MYMHVYICVCTIYLYIYIPYTRRVNPHKDTDREQQPDTHAYDKNNTPDPRTNTPHKHLTTLEGGATTVRATSHDIHI